MALSLFPNFSDGDARDSPAGVPPVPLLEPPQIPPCQRRRPACPGSYRSAAAAVDLAVAHHGRLDILYSNAGISGSTAHAPLAALTDFDRVMAANTRSTVAGVKHAARVMVPRRSGCILCTGSTTGMLGGIAALPYSLSKATVVGVVRLVAEELARAGVRVNTISPHAIGTPLLVRSLATANPGVGDEALKWMVEMGMSSLQGAVLEPEDVATSCRLPGV